MRPGLVPGPCRGPWRVALGLTLLALAAAALPAQPGEDPFAECEETYRAGGEQWRCCSCFFTVAREHNLWLPAARRLEDHLEDDPENAWLRFYLGRIEMDQDLDAAEGTLDEAARELLARGESEGAVYSLTNLARFLAARGRLEEAAVRLADAVVAAEASGEVELLAEVAVQQGALEARRPANLEPIYRRLHQLEGQIAPEAPYTLRRDVLSTLGAVTFELGRFRESRSYLERALDLALEHGDRYSEAATRYQMLANLIAEKPYARARREAEGLARAALEAAEAGGNRYVEAAALWLLGKLAPAAEARELLERSVEIAADTGDPALLGRCQGALAVALVDEDPREAERLLDEAEARLAEAGDERSMIYGWLDRMTVRWARRPRDEAVRDALAVLELIERQRELQDLGPGRAGFFAVWTEAYYWLSGRLLATARETANRETANREDLRLAFEITERMRARVLQDALTASAAAPAPAAASHPAQAAALRPPRFASLEEIEASLAEREALLSFQLSPRENLFGDFTGGSWLTVSTRRGTRIYPLPGSDELEPKTGMFLHLFERRDGEEALPATSLYHALFGEALAELPPGVSRLWIVPDGLLHLLPFGALRPEVGAPLLAESYELSILPSATLWQGWRNARPEPGRRSALVLADPAWGVREAAGPEGERGWDPAGLGPLPQARREGRAVRRHLGGRAELRLGERASERSVKTSELTGVGLLHFAAHAVIDERFPRRSAIVLAPGSPAEDGLLQPGEIAGLDLDGRIVVLSACRSASGNVLRGEGPMSLARAFFQAGAPAVVGSLWPLRDEEAAALFDGFYRHLALGRSISEALTAVQRDWIQAGAPPEAWAGVVVLGNGDLVPLPGGTGPSGLRPWHWLVLAGLLAGAALAAWSRGRNFLDPSEGFRAPGRSFP